MLARNSLFSLAGSIIPVVITVITLPFLLQIIGVERYGALALCWLILIYSAQTLGGVGTAITHALARLDDDGEAARETMVSGFVTTLVLSAFASGLAYAVSWVFFAEYFQVNDTVQQELMNAVWLIAASTFVSGVSRSCHGALYGKGRIPSASLATLAGNGGLPIFALCAAYWINSTMVVLLWASLLARCLAFALMFGDLWFSQLRGHRMQFSWDRSKKLLRFGVWIMVTMFVAPVLVTMDRMVIGAQLGAISVAAYTIPFQIISRLQLVPQSLINVLFPRLSVSKGEKARQMALNYSVLMTAFFAPVIVGLIFLIEPLLVFWLGAELDPRSATVGRWLLCAFLLNAIVSTMVMYLQSQERGDFVAKFQMAEIVPYFGLLFFCATTFGLQGVVGAFFARRAFEAIIFVWQSRLGNSDFWKTQVPTMLGVAFALLLTDMVDQFIWKLLLATVLACATFAAAIWMFPQELKAMAGEQVRKRLYARGHGSQN
ncbi:MAG: oligosaccharide flippase family protein [Erythrobacter sp.]|uniref:oligosaccharide flippase family protein n=1 Tax=Erythrobacter sp. TaxID=1042 RepID=UPI00329888C2